MFFLTRWRKHSSPPERIPELNNPNFRCCGCCHVQTGTICLGIYNLVTQAVCLVVLAFVILHPEALLDDDRSVKPFGFDREMDGPSTNWLLLPGEEGKKEKGETVMLSSKLPSEPGEDTDIAELPPLESLETLPTPLPDKGPETREFDLDISSSPLAYSKADMLSFTKRRVLAGTFLGDAHLALALVFGLILITMFLIYGTAKGRPVYLLPFFCFQVFDFILACLTAVGHYTWLPNVDHMLRHSTDFPFRGHLTKFNAQWLALFILLMYMCVLMVKAYCIRVVWACYQYLHTRNTIVLTYTAGGGSNDSEDLLLPPDYEAATKLPQSEAVPPMYSVPPPMYSTN